MKEGRERKAISNVPRPSSLYIFGMSMKMKVQLTTRRYPERRYIENGGKVSYHSNDVEASFDLPSSSRLRTFVCGRRREGRRLAWCLKEGRGEYATNHLAAEVEVGG